MQDIEPYYKWRGKYIASDDSKSPFYGRQYDEFNYSQKIYNYYIHPQWDNFGSSTLYTKILFANYEEGYAILEMLGEWNDCITNDIMYLKREVMDKMIPKGIHKFILICENVLSFHASDDCYYEEWYEDVRDEDGWICFLNLLNHVEEEMQDIRLQHYINLGSHFDTVNWRPHKPENLYKAIETMINSQAQQLEMG